MTKAILFLAVVGACDDDARPVVDAAIDAMPWPIDAHPINWGEWGNPCGTNPVVLHTCMNAAAATGWCVLDEPRVETAPGVFAGTCRPGCQTTSCICPDDSTRVTAAGQSIDWCRQN